MNQTVYPEEHKLKIYTYENSHGLTHNIEAKDDEEAILKAKIIRKYDWSKGKAALWTDAPRKIRSWR